MLPNSIKKFIERFSSLPSIGPRQATRLGFYIARLGRAKIQDISSAIAGLGNIHICSRCFFMYETIHNSSKNICHICADSKRNHNIIAILEKETDLISLEKTNQFNGRYLVLGEIARDGMLSSEQKLRLKSLQQWIHKTLTQAEEIIVAMNPTTLGDIEAGLIIQEIKPFAKKITRLGRGLPTGGEIEFADEDTLGGALENRR
jgi:recombination protein RecR